MVIALARRRSFDPPPSQLATWSRRVAVFSLMVAVLAIIIARADLLEAIPVLVTFGAALALAGFAIVIAVAALVVLWCNGGRGFMQAASAMLIGMALIAYPAYLAYLGYMLPAIHDITTDPIDPPRFDIVARLRPPNSSVYPGLATAEVQKETWPDIEPLVVNATPKAAYDGAMNVITKRKWRVVDSRPPEPGRDGHIEAIARSLIMGFRDDVVVRIRPTRQGATVDIRSAARFGRGDLGDNAKRVLALIDDIDDAASAEKPEQPPRPQKPAPAAVAAKPVQRGARR